FGNLECQATWLEVGVSQRLLKNIQDPIVSQHRRGYVHRQAIGPKRERGLADGLDRFRKDLSGQSFHAPRMLALLDEIGWSDRAAFRIVPADESLEPAERFGR